MIRNKEVSGLYLSEPHSVVVSITCSYAGEPGLIPGKGVETLGSVCISHSLTIPRCKIGTSPMWEDRMALVLYGM